jgi:hypothetical protein
MQLVRLYISSIFISQRKVVEDEFILNKTSIMFLPITVMKLNVSKPCRVNIPVKSLTFIGYEHTTVTRCGIQRRVKGLKVKIWWKITSEYYPYHSSPRPLEQ